MYLLKKVYIRKEYDGNFTISITASPDIDDAELIDAGIRLSQFAYSSDSFIARCHYDPVKQEFHTFNIWFYDTLVSELIRPMTSEEEATTKAYIWRTPQITGKILGV